MNNAHHTSGAGTMELTIGWNAVDVAGNQVVATAESMKALREILDARYGQTGRITRRFADVQGCGGNKAHYQAPDGELVLIHKRPTRRWEG